MRPRWTPSADGHIDADDVLSLLVQDGVHRDGGLAGLAVPNDQLTLSPADGHHCVDGQDAGLEGYIDRLAADHAAGLVLNGAGLGGLNGAEAVNGLAQHVHHPADRPSPTGTSAARRCGAPRCPPRTPASLPSSTTPTLSRARFMTMPFTPGVQLTSSPYTA